MNEPPPLPENRLCSRCGANIQPGANFCHACGAAVPKAVLTTTDDLTDNPPKPQPKRMSGLKIFLLLSFVGIAGLCVIGIMTERSRSAQQAGASTKPEAKPTKNAATPEIRKAKPVSSPSPAESDRLNEYVTVQKRAPHEQLRIWPVGDKIGMDVLVPKGVTDEQIATIARWYISINASVIIFYDDRANAEKHQSMVADYMDGSLTRHIYTWQRNGDLKDWKMKSIKF